MKTLLLCRHAKSDWGVDQDDFNRPLKKRGLRDLSRMGTLLKENGFFPDLIISSPATRALETAKGLASLIGYEKKIIENEKIYEASHGELFSIVQDLPEEADIVMVVGHNPAMESLAGMLASIDSGLVMPTCAMACLGIAGRWKNISPGNAILRWYLIPGILRPLGETEE